jgi:hypothetical protein
MVSERIESGNLALVSPIGRRGQIGKRICTLGCGGWSFLICTYLRYDSLSCIITAHNVYFGVTRTTKCVFRNVSTFYLFIYEANYIGPTVDHRYPWACALKQGLIPWSLLDQDYLYIILPHGIRAGAAGKVYPQVTATLVARGLDKFGR